MKRIASLLLVAVVLLSMAAPPATAQEDSPSDTESPAPSDYDGLEDWIDWWLWFLGENEPE